MKSNYGYYVNNDGDRFWVPFLLGGLGGAAVVGLSRPRPVYVTGGTSYPYPGPYPYPYPYPYRGGYGYSNSNYNYFY